MLDSLQKIGPMPREARHSDFPSQPVPPADGGDPRLIQLLQQEQFWFSWIAVLHERLTKVHPAEGVASEGLKVLEVAKRHWVEAKLAVRQYQAGG